LAIVAAEHHIAMFEQGLQNVYCQDTNFYFTADIYVNKLLTDISRQNGQRLTSN
jgi:hypothetical protein